MSRGHTTGAGARFCCAGGASGSLGLGGVSFGIAGLTCPKGPEPRSRGHASPFSRGQAVGTPEEWVQV